jgi:hypothetical protein
MCHVINLAMSQTQILEHVYNGLRRSSVIKIYPLKPRTCPEFLEMVKINTETSILLDRKSWEEKDDSVPTTAAISMVREEKSAWKDNLNFEKIFNRTTKDDRRFQNT